MSGPKPIPARAEPIAAHDAFEAHRMKGLLWLERPSTAEVDCPRGLNIDGCIIIDMRADGRVEGIEFLCRIPRPRQPRGGEPMHALFITDTPVHFSATAAGLTLAEKTTHAGALRSAHPPRPRSGAYAEIAEGRLTALTLEFAP